ncbi:MAG: class I SAM-dependent methyltransferase [Planctomycetes bacterium]|nr:class I SAM-dependent methyltransferase [Planctomycetota bacterium]
MDKTPERSVSSGDPDGGAAEFSAYSVPPEVYDLAMTSDLSQECKRALFVAREQGVEPASVLELGCGTGRLMPAMADLVPRVVGIEIDPLRVSRAQARLRDAGLQGRCAVHVGDMRRFGLGAQFDLIYFSPNTIRHLLDPSDYPPVWRCCRSHLRPSGVVVVDLVLGYVAEPTGEIWRWGGQAEGVIALTEWRVRRGPSVDDPTTHIEWFFERQTEGESKTWVERFPLRAFEADTFVQCATHQTGLAFRGLFEPRDPYLIAIDAAHAAGRTLVALQRSGEQPIPTTERGMGFQPELPARGAGFKQRSRLPGCE